MSKRQIVPVALGVLCAMSIAAPAAAQSTEPEWWVKELAKDNYEDQLTITQDIRNRRTMSERESYARAYIHASMVSNCIVGRAGPQAGELLGGPATQDKKYERLSNALMDEYRACMKSDAAGIPMEVFNYTLAEQSVLAEAPVLEPRVSKIDEGAKAFIFADHDPRKEADMAMIGRCAAVVSPGLAFEVLKTVPGSDRELSALGDLYRKSPECGVDDVPEKVPTGFQRGVLAAGLYHWTHRG